MKPIMSAPKQTGCLFCPNPTVGLGFVSVEHPIPESMGGELIIRDVCKPCNDYFGREVDCLADVPIVLLLRREAGLTTGKDLSGAYYNERRGTLARARQDQEGRIYPHSPFYQSGDIVEVTAPTQEEAETMAAQVEAAFRRKGRIFTPQPAMLIRDENVQFRVLQEGEQIERFKRLLGREAAKIAIEWIAVQCGPRVALDPALDAARHYARHDAQLLGVVAGYCGPPVVWFPKFGQSVKFKGSAISVEEQQEFLDSLPALGRPPGLPQVASPVHGLSFAKTQEDGCFALKLFGCLVALVPLPESLPLPWGREDLFDLSRKRSSTRWLRTPSVYRLA